MPVQDPVLYAVCDGEKARFLRYDGQQMRTVQRFGAHDKDTDAVGEVASIKEPRSDPKVQVKERFARQIAHEIETTLDSNSALEGLILAAAPHVLHDIREHLSKAASKKLIKSQSKDLTNIPDHDLLSHFDRPATGWPTPDFSISPDFVLIVKVRRGGVYHQARRRDGHGRNYPDGSGEAILISTLFNRAKARTSRKIHDEDGFLKHRAL